MVKAGKMELSVQGKTIANVTKCSLEYASESIEVNGITDIAKKRIAGMRNWSVSAESAVEFMEATGHALLIKTMNSGDKVDVIVRLDESNTLNGSGYIDSLSISVNAGESAAMSINITGSGALNVAD